jgi:hypothetical protein
MPFPLSSEQALENTDKLAICTSLRVWINKKYPEIMSHCFDGTHFGKQEPGFIVPTTESKKLIKPLENKTLSFADFDDDIPF